MSIDNLVAIGDEFNALKAKFTQEATERFKSALLEVFDKHPEIRKFGWTQYTPYFNDGSPCTFRVGDIMFLDDKDDEEDRDEDDIYEWKYLWKSGYDALEALSKFLNDNEEVAEIAFGDHVKVIVTREGVEVEEYDHD